MARAIRQSAATRDARSRLGLPSFSQHGLAQCSGWKQLGLFAQPLRFDSEPFKRTELSVPPSSLHIALLHLRKGGRRLAPLLSPMPVLPGDWKIVQWKIGRCESCFARENIFREMPDAQERLAAQFDQSAPGQHRREPDRRVDSALQDNSRTSGIYKAAAKSSFAKGRADRKARN